MPSTITQAELRTMIEDRTDLTNSSYPVDARTNEYINQALGELYDLLITSYEDYFYTTGNITLVSGTQAYDLPTGFYKALKVFYISGTKKYELKRFMMDELSDDVFSDAPSVVDNRYLRYRIMGSKILFTPIPGAGGTVQVWYVPELTKLDTDGTDDDTAITFDVPVQWEEYLVLAAAIKLLDREESDSTAMRVSKAELEQKIRAAAVNRDAGEPMRMRDVSGRFTRKYHLYG